MNTISNLRLEAQEAVDRLWFVQGVEEIDRANRTVIFRLSIRLGLFVQIFLGETTGSFYMALIKNNQRIFGIDREEGEWHLHPHGDVAAHESLAQGMEPKPLLTFLRRVEMILLEHDLV